MEYSAHYESSYGQEDEQWEYYVAIIAAEVNERTWSEMSKYYPGRSPHDVPVYTVQSMLMDLNKLGAMGWQMISMQPVRVGRNGDILVDAGQSSRQWSHRYLCSFKRRKRT